MGTTKRRATHSSLRGPSCGHGGDLSPCLLALGVRVARGQCAGLEGARLLPQDLARGRGAWAPYTPSLSIPLDLIALLHSILSLPIHVPPGSPARSHASLFSRLRMIGAHVPTPGGVPGGVSVGGRLGLRAGRVSAGQRATRGRATAEGVLGQGTHTAISHITLLFSHLRYVYTAFISP